VVYDQSEIVAYYWGPNELHIGPDDWSTAADPASFPPTLGFSEINLDSIAVGETLRIHPLVQVETGKGLGRMLVQEIDGTGDGVSLQFIAPTSEGSVEHVGHELQLVKSFDGSAQAIKRVFVKHSGEGSVQDPNFPEFYNDFNTADFLASPPVPATIASDSRRKIDLNRGDPELSSDAELDAVVVQLCFDGAETGAPCGQMDMASAKSATWIVFLPPNTKAFSVPLVPDEIEITNFDSDFAGIKKIGVALVETDHLPGLGNTDVTWEHFRRNPPLQILDDPREFGTMRMSYASLFSGSAMPDDDMGTHADQGMGDCQEGEHVCNESLGCDEAECVECVEDTHCPDEEQACDEETHTCVTTQMGDADMGDANMRGRG
jgi:hypothetical protein